MRLIIDAISISNNIVIQMPPFLHIFWKYVNCYIFMMTKYIHYSIDKLSKKSNVAILDSTNCSAFCEQDLLF